MASHEAFDRILALLQRSMLDDALWPATSALIDEVCGTRGNGLVVGPEDDVPQIYFSMYLSRGDRLLELEREYFEVYHDRDEALPRLRALPDGQLVHIPDLYTEEEKKTSPAYNEMLRRLGVSNGLDVHFDEPDGLRMVWAIGDPDGGSWQSGQLRLIERLLPHVRLFVRMRQALAAADASNAGLAGLLDNSRIGVLHLDRSGRLLAANAPALAILRRGDGLSDSGGTLHAEEPADQERFRKLLRRALPNFSGEPPSGGSMTLRRPCRPAPLRLHVSPVGGVKADFGALRVAALVLVVDPLAPPRIDPVRVAEVLGLTPSQGRVAALLAEGRSVPDIAAATGLRPGYVRTLLKRVYRKQEVSGQVALVPRILAVDALPLR